jgi:hypothetical protein
MIVGNLYLSFIFSGLDFLQRAGFLDGSYYFFHVVQVHVSRRASTVHSRRFTTALIGTSYS